MINKDSTEVCRGQSLLDVARQGCLGQGTAWLSGLLLSSLFMNQ